MNYHSAFFFSMFIIIYNEHIFMGSRGTRFRSYVSLGCVGAESCSAMRIVKRQPNSLLSPEITR